MSVYIHNEKPKDPDVILAEIEKRIATKKMDLFLIGKVFELADKWQGKKLTKRISNALQERLGSDYKVFLDPSYGMLNLDVWYGTPPNQKKFRAFIAYSDKPYFDIERVKESNISHTLDKGRIEKLEAGKAKVAELVTRWNAAIATLQVINKEAEKYELQYTIEIDHNK